MQFLSFDQVAGSLLRSMDKKQVDKIISYLYSAADNAWHIIRVQYVFAKLINTSLTWHLCSFLPFLCSLLFPSAAYLPLKPEGKTFYSLLKLNGKRGLYFSSTPPPNNPESQQAQKEHSEECTLLSAEFRSEHRDWISCWSLLNQGQSGINILLEKLKVAYS